MSTIGLVIIWPFLQLIEQLKVGGRMVIPVGKNLGDQTLETIDKLPNGEIKRNKLMGVVYVPLTDKKNQI